MQTPEQNRGKCRHGIQALARRFSLRSPGAYAGQGPEDPLGTGRNFGVD